MTNGRTDCHGGGTHAHLPGGARRHSVTRRQLVTTASVLAGTALAGCGGEATAPGPPPGPTSLLGSKQCDFCGMVIEDHPGPNGQIYYRDHGPETHDNPAWFESLRSCLFPYYFEKGRLDWTADAVYVTDYSVVDYRIEEVAGDAFIPSFTDPETFADATRLTFVVGSEVYGSMGQAFVPFSDEDDAAAFSDEYGGEQVSFEEIGPDMLGR